MILNQKIHIFSDFDGTITNTDSLVFLTRALGAGEEFIVEIGRQIRSNEITLRQGISAEMGSIRATFAEARDLLLQQVKVDPDFKKFVEWCEATQIPLTVLSAGFHEFIDLFLTPQEYPTLEILASRINPQPTGWECLFRDDSDYGNDKAAAIQRARNNGYYTIFLGDGLSDRTAAEAADVVFAKRSLAEHCRANSIPFTEFQTFAEVLIFIHEVHEETRSKEILPIVSSPFV